MNDYKREYDRLKSDLLSNKGNSKSIFVLFFFRISRFSNALPRFLSLILLPVRIFYKIIVIYVMGIDLPISVNLGGGARIYHGVGLVVHPDVVIGAGAVLRHGVTIGNIREGGGVPRIGNNVDFGCHCSVLGDIDIGENVSIGAGSVVVKSLPNNCTAVGIPAKVVKIKF